MDGQKTEGVTDFLSTKELAGRWRCNSKTAEKKARALGVPMMQLGPETLLRRSDIENLEQQIFDKKLPLGGTSNGQGRHPGLPPRKVA